MVLLGRPMALGAGVVDYRVAVLQVKATICKMLAHRRWQFLAGAFLAAVFASGGVVIPRVRIDRSPCCARNNRTHGNSTGTFEVEPSGD